MSQNSLPTIEELKIKLMCERKSVMNMYKHILTSTNSTNIQKNSCLIEFMHKYPVLDTFRSNNFVPLEFACINNYAVVVDFICKNHYKTYDYKYFKKLCEAALASKRYCTFITLVKHSNVFDKTFIDTLMYNANIDTPNKFCKALRCLIKLVDDLGIPKTYITELSKFKQYVKSEIHRDFSCKELDMTISKPMTFGKLFFTKEIMLHYILYVCITNVTYIFDVDRCESILQKYNIYENKQTLTEYYNSVCFEKRFIQNALNQEISRDYKTSSVNPCIMFLLHCKSARHEMINILQSNINKRGLKWFEDNIIRYNLNIRNFLWSIDVLYKLILPTWPVRENNGDEKDYTINDMINMSENSLTKLNVAKSITQIFVTDHVYFNDVDACKQVLSRYNLQLKHLCKTIIDNHIKNIVITELTDEKVLQAPIKPFFEDRLNSLERFDYLCRLSNIIRHCYINPDNAQIVYNYDKFKRVMIKYHVEHEICQLVLPREWSNMDFIRNLDPKNLQNLFEIPTYKTNAHMIKYITKKHSENNILFLYAIQGLNTEAIDRILKKNKYSEYALKRIEAELKRRNERRGLIEMVMGCSVKRNQTKNNNYAPNKCKRLLERRTFQFVREYLFTPWPIRQRR